MNSVYSILVLRGTQVRRFVISQKELRQIVLAGITMMFAVGVYFSEYLEAKRKKADAVVAQGQAQKEKLAALRNRAQEVQKTLSHWKGLHERIQASLSDRNRSDSENRHAGDELQHFLAVLQGELKQMIAALPSEWPVHGRVVSGVGMRPSPWTGKMAYHAGLDIPKPMGTPVVASGDAVVESIDSKLGTIVLNHGQEIKTKYAHLSKVFVKEGERVRQGQPIAAVGNVGRSTGPHLHYEVRVAGVAIDPREGLISATHAE
ncbi:MAG: peptidoglycan DD-metalloendopeptidase family protein [Deltaproteobacteria bacterium]|nr:peptidoglycan DD-metalloendopeptidase family protein [Deltaproteobacteria bacterium]